jgi:phosphatidylglycerol:prolipoprotein diacylglycerol transferase
MGCLLNGCCFGRTCDLPWAITYPTGHPTHTPGGIGTPVHPVQIYDSLLNLALFISLEILFRKRRFDGQVFASYLIGFALTRSLAETFRGDYTAAHVHAGLTPGQWLSVAIFLTGLALFAVLRARAIPRR